MTSIIGEVYLFVLIGGDSHKAGLLEHVCPEGTVRKLQDVIGLDEVKARLVFVHGVQDRLESKKKNNDIYISLPYIHALQ